MTAALQTPAVSCPVCGGDMYDNRATKKNPKQPDFKCRRYKDGCEGVIWPPKPVKMGSRGPIAPHANVPDQQLPPLLQNQEAEDAAELRAKIGDGRKEAIDALKATHALALRHAVQYTLEKILPLYEEKEIALTGDEMYKHAYTIFQTWEDKGLIE